ncbi:MAG: TVP38/TMEM64 family protein [Proteobacteria bacterium]|nr:TVP38/TMEM64 family protein [Pseudomonadota bacterium]MBU1714091.1 TVP38/TMEM64 family protein [Pseudomonadota bacterium]
MNSNKHLIQKIGIMVLIIAAIAFFFYFDLGRYFTLDYLKQSHEQFTRIYSQHQIAVIAAYMMIYIIITALSLPGAAIMTLAGGGLFGLVTGSIVVSFASTIGATLACLVSRFLLRDWVQHKFADRLKTINEGIEKEGGFYLLSLRLVPLFPFFVINLVMGITKIPILTYYWVSQLGMLPATIIFVNAGKELAKIDSISGILSPGLLISFAILGLFPLTTKKLLNWYKAKKEL